MTFRAPEVSGSEPEYFVLLCESMGAPYQLSCSLPELRKAPFLFLDALESFCRQHIMFCASLRVSTCRYMNSRRLLEFLEEPQQCGGFPEDYNYMFGSF